MKKVQRFDTARISAHYDDNGFLFDNPTVARIGLQIYQKADGTERREFRPASEVFNPRSLKSYQGKPITLGHVTVNSKNAKEVVVGSCSGQGVRNGIGVDVPVIVYDDGAIDKAKRRIAAELSVGYTSEDIEEPGWGYNETGEYILDSQKNDQDNIPETWVRFDALQTNIDVNHVAMVFKGRAGVAKLNLDSEQDFPYDCNEINDSSKDEIEMKKIKIDGAEIEVSAEAAPVIETLIRTSAEKAEQITAQRDQLQAKVDGFEATLNQKVAEAVAQAKQDALAMGELVNFATSIGVKCDGLEPKAIKLACLKEMSGKEVAADKSDAYIDSAFDFAKDAFDPAAQNRSNVFGKPKEDADGTDKNDAADDIPDPMKRFKK